MAEIFQKNILKLKKLISLGDIFQANITTKCEIESSKNYNPLDIYLKIRSKLRAPFGGIIINNNYKEAVLSTSPERFLKIDNNKFHSLMKESKELAKKNWKGSGDKSIEEIWFTIKDKTEPTEFLGYETNTSEGVIKFIIKDNKEVNFLSEGEEGHIILNQTPFYGESGGQVGDQGIISNSKCKINIQDTQKKMGDLFVHYGTVQKGTFAVGDSVNLEINIQKRNNARANHSATHLLHESLRRTLGKHVTQKGSLVSPDRLRFDFSHNKPIEKDEMYKINKNVNELVDGASDVQTRIMTPKQAFKNKVSGIVIGRSLTKGNIRNNTKKLIDHLNK